MSKLSIKNLKKNYKSKTVVNDISLEVNLGEVVGILGPNGAGKTTCFYMIVGLIPADSGEIKLNDITITHMPMHARANLGIGYLPQEASVFRKLTVEENILAVLETDPELDKEQRQEKLESLLNEFNLVSVRKTLGLSLSGGERRRVEIARSIARKPKFILLDEPFSGVDPISVLDIKQFIRQLKDMGIGVIITDHNVRETLDICQKAYIIHNGTLMTSGSPNEILNNQQVREVYLGQEFDL